MDVDKLLDGCGYFTHTNKKPNTLYFVVGDVHGMGDEMLEIIDAMKQYALNRSFDYDITFLGDLIDRGPDFERVIRTVDQDPRITSLTGNHEMLFLEEYSGVREKRSHARNINHDKLFTVDDRQHLVETMTAFPFARVINTTQSIFVMTHAPQHINVIRMFVNDWYGALRKIPAIDFCMGRDVYEWVDIKTDRRVEFFYGHVCQHYTPIEQQIDVQKGCSVKTYNLDSGCVFGNYLLGYCLNDQTIFKTGKGKHNE